MIARIEMFISKNKKQQSKRTTVRNCMPNYVKNIGKDMNRKLSEYLVYKNIFRLDVYTKQNLVEVLHNILVYCKKLDDINSMLQERDWVKVA